MSAESRIHSGFNPSFGFIVPGGAMIGSAVHDLRRANELARRGYDVNVFWAIDQTPQIPLDSRVRQHWLFCAGRYGGLTKNLFRLRYSSLDDRLGKWIAQALTPGMKQKLYQQKRGFDVVEWALSSLIEHVCLGVEQDRRLLKKFATQLDALGVTHLMPNLSIFGPICHAVQKYTRHNMEYLITFQGYELYANFARPRNLEQRLYEVIRNACRHSAYPAVALSGAYRRRVIRDIALPEQDIIVIPACVNKLPRVSDAEAVTKVRSAFPDFNPDLPMVTFFGRQDSEKGIDLLLYASKILAEKRVEFQIALCGPTAWGTIYQEACRQIAENLRLKTMSTGFVSESVRNALLQRSHCVVYPPIHEEPFGMAPVEAMSLGTPIIVPDNGGLASVPHLGEFHGGLNFRVWDSGSLSLQLETMLTDRATYDKICEDTVRVADHYSAEMTCDRLLTLLEKPGKPICDPDVPGDVPSYA